MPEYQAFLRGFGIKKGIRFDNYILEEIYITHDVIEEYHRYEYHITMKFNGNGDIDELLSNFKNYIKGNRIINSRYGNPYKCNFGDPKITASDENNIIVESIGTAFRVYY